MRHEILNESHDACISNFDCAVEDQSILSFGSGKKRRKLLQHSADLNNFLKQEALREQNQSLNTTHLFINDDDVLVGFVSLCSDCLQLDVQERMSLSLSRFSIPAIKIARLGVHKDFQGQGYGKILINFSVHTADLVNSDYSGTRFLTVDCYEHRVSFYTKYGFIQNNVQNANRQGDSPLSFRLNIIDYLENFV